MYKYFYIWAILVFTLALYSFRSIWWLFPEYKCMWIKRNLFSTFWVGVFFLSAYWLCLCRIYTCPCWFRFERMRSVYMWILHEERETENMPFSVYSIEWHGLFAFNDKQNVQPSWTVQWHTLTYTHTFTLKFCDLMPTESKYYACCISTSPRSRYSSVYTWRWWIVFISHGKINGTECTIKLTLKRRHFTHLFCTIFG